MLRPNLGSGFALIGDDRGTYRLHVGFPFRLDPCRLRLVCFGRLGPTLREGQFQACGAAFWNKIYLVLFLYMVLVLVALAFR